MHSAHILNNSQLFISVSEINPQNVFGAFHLPRLVLISTREHQNWRVFFFKRKHLKKTHIFAVSTDSVQYLALQSVASCGYSQYVGGDCGANPERPAGNPQKHCVFTWCFDSWTHLFKAWINVNFNSTLIASQ